MITFGLFLTETDETGASEGKQKSLDGDDKENDENEEDEEEEDGEEEDGEEKMVKKKMAKKKAIIKKITMILTFWMIICPRFHKDRRINENIHRMIVLDNPNERVRESGDYKL